MMYSLFILAKTDTVTEVVILSTRAYRLTLASLLFFVLHWADLRRATYLCLGCTKKTNIYIAFVIHVNFDHAWAEHYPVTLT